jgi:predicted phage tail protein
VFFNRVVGNIFIATGALFPAMAGSLIKAGLVDWLYVSELLGVVIMYIGFLQATASQPVEAKQTASQQPNN